MDARTIAAVSKWPKRALADWLAAHGTVYPTAVEMRQWSKDELVNSVIERMAEGAKQASALPGGAS